MLNLIFNDFYFVIQIYSKNNTLFMFGQKILILTYETFFKINCASVS